MKEPCVAKLIVPLQVSKHQRLKALAALQGRSMSVIVREAIDAVLILAEDRALAKDKLRISGLLG